MSFTPPPYTQPKNQLWDFTGLNKGVDAVGKALDQQANRLLQEEQLAENKRRWEASHGLAQERLNLAKQQAARGPGGMKPTATMRHFKMAQQNPKFAEFLDRRRPQTTTNVNVGFEKSYDKEIGKQLAKDFKAYQTEGAKARVALNDLNVMEKALQDPNVYSGSGGEALQSIKKFGQALGLKVKGVGTGDLINTINKKIAVGMKDNLPGPLSDGDRKFLEKMAAGLNYTPEGNRLIIQMAKLQREYTIARARAFREYSKANGGRPDSGVYQFIEQKVGKPYTQRFSGLIQKLKAEGEAAPRSPTAGFPQIKSADDYNRLQSGQTYIDPDGNQRTKP